MPSSKLVYIAILAIMAAGPVPALAADVAVTSASNATGLCQSALPVFDGVIRKRPLAIQNEGTSDAFISCAMTFDEYVAYPSKATVYAGSIDGAAHQVSCTAITGRARGFNYRATKTITVPASGDPVAFVWEAYDFYLGASNFPSPLLSLTCLLPPGTGLNDTYVDSTVFIPT